MTFLERVNAAKPDELLDLARKLAAACDHHFHDGGIAPLDEVETVDCRICLLGYALAEAQETP
ncbi:MAG: hypothetical protein WC683_06035 [bacterium]